MSSSFSAVSGRWLAASLALCGPPLFAFACGTVEEHPNPVQTVKPDGGGGQTATTTTSSSGAGGQGGEPGVGGAGEGGAGGHGGMGQAGGPGVGGGGAGQGGQGGQSGVGGSGGQSGVGGSGGQGGQSGVGGSGGQGGQSGVGGSGGQGGQSGVGGGGQGGQGGQGPLCTTVVQSHAIDASPHVAACSPVTYSTNPPTSGPHYPIWAAFKTYTSPVPRGYWVHSLEHGAVVISYNCPAGCDAELANLQAFLDAQLADPLCVAPLKNRFIVTPDPKLDVLFAASAWGFSLRSDCFDLQALAGFIAQYYAVAPENFCVDGVDVVAAGIPAGCGDP